MGTLGTLLHIIVWYGTVLLIVVFFLTGTGKLIVDGIRGANTRIRRLTWQHVKRGAAGFIYLVLAVITIAALQNNGEPPAWLEPPSLSSLREGDVAATAVVTQAPGGDLP